ncbi:tripartite motif-containing protein 5-like isoform X1 [Molossus molossus]|uniref:tripartite motif-containing protein 5-like isoform X1 n=1 Tax=Molossus molossus TaxID=27622 RepID=UPI0017467B07|nr:tripartite motif-containing protein 5-like isoform X1 [Molossus molossus]
MASGVLENLKEEVNCPICLELLKKPMCLDCGHSFCQACITANNKEPMTGQEGESHCPVCRLSYQPENLRPSRHLANIVETLREVKLSPEKKQKRDLCVHHGEKLLLFCKEDEKIICWVCERSQEHRGHHTFLMEEVAQEYKEKLQEALKRLKAEQQKAEKLGTDLEEQRTTWKDLIDKDSQSVQDCFKNVRGILDSEEQKELNILKQEETDVLNDLAQTECELVQQSQLLEDLISDLEHRLQGSTLEMMQDVHGIMERSRTFSLKTLTPKTLSKEQRRVFQAPDWQQILQVFNTHVTLEYPMAIGNTHISEDKKQVAAHFRLTRGFLYGNDIEDHGVLGSPLITSGKHYWEVDVSNKYSWSLGVYSGKRPDLNTREFVIQDDCKHVCSRYQPKFGYWVIGLQNRFDYKAFVNSASSDASTLTLFLTVHPRRVGVFLDYSARTVSFCNVTNHGTLIYKFSSCSFPQEIFPYFNPMKRRRPLKLCSPSS